MRDCPSQCQDTISTTTTTTTYLTRDQTTPLLQVATYRKNHNLFHYFVLTGLILLISIGLSSSFFMLVIVSTKLRPLSIQNILLLDLLTSDILVCTIVMPGFAFEAYHPEQQLPSGLCIMLAFLLYYFQGCHLCALVLISVHRYCSILFVNRI